MSIGRIIRHFENRTNLAVRLNEVTRAVTGMGVQDEIVFHPVDIDENKLRGVFRLSCRRDGVYTDPVLRADIGYAQTSSDDWRRIVCVKEMMHLFDSDPHKAAAEDDIDRLVSRMARPPELRHLQELDHEFNDRAAILPALAVLMPMAIRNQILPDFRDGLKSSHEIAHLAGIPDRYIGTLMSDTWDEVYPALCSIGENAHG